MPISDLFLVFKFWLTYAILGWIAFPFTQRVFHRFLDRGFVFAKILGVTVVGFLIWLFSCLKILPFAASSLYGIIGLLFLFSVWFYKKNSFIWKKDLLYLILFEEAIFAVCLVYWSYVRGFQPVIEGLEKYMDFGFVNAILRSEFLPPHDMWLAGYTINYYYFGHLICAMLSLLSQIPPFFAYNLMIAVIFALCFSASFSLVLNFCHATILALGKKMKSVILLIIVALLGAYLVSCAGNLQTVYHLLTKGSESYWYPDATRFIVKKFGASDETIHEFPFYSFVVADLHGHVSNIPMVLFSIAFIFSLFLEIIHASNFSFWLSPFRVWQPIALGFCLGVSYMTNAMDGPVYFALSGLTISIGLLIKEKLHNIKKLAVKIVLFFVIVGATFILTDFFFLKNFKNFTDGIMLTQYHSPLWMLGVLWGFQYFTVISFLLFLFGKHFLRTQNLVKAFASFFGQQIKFVNEKAVQKIQLNPIDLFFLGMILLSTGLIVFPEIFYVKDIYINEYQRANTMFKMTYQSFIMLYLSVAYIFFRFFEDLISHPRKIWFFPTLGFIILSLLGTFSVGIYPKFAIKSYYGMTNYLGLDGLIYLQNLYPDDYEFISRLNSNKSPIPITPQTVICEAVGDSYTKYARISANTGISTVLGWPVHEWLWRNGYDIPGKRTADVQMIYESEDLAQTKALLREYKVNYLWVSKMEREKYLKINEKKFAKLGKVIYQTGKSQLYKID